MVKFCLIMTQSPFEFLNTIRPLTLKHSYLIFPSHYIVEHKYSSQAISNFSLGSAGGSLHSKITYVSNSISCQFFVLKATLAHDSAYLAQMRQIKTELILLCNTI